MSALRPATADDIEALLDLWEALMDCGTEADPRFRRAPGARPVMRDYMRTWFTPQPFSTVWLAFDADRPVGMVRAFPVTGAAVVDLAATVRIGDMYVKDSHRRLGIGRDLVEALLSSAREAGYPRVEVGTLAKDARAVAFWKGIGFGDWQVTLSREA